MPQAIVSLQLQSQVGPQIAAAANAYKQLATAEQQAEQAALRYAAASQRVEIGSQRLAIQTANAAKAQIQAESAALRLAAAQNKVAGGSGLAAQFADGLKSGLLGIVGPAALATGAIAALKGVADLTVAGETTNRVARSFEQLALQAGTSGSAILNALRKASGGEISDLNLQLATNKGQLLGVSHSAEGFAEIMTVARDRAAKMGITTTQAFDDINTGIGRESRMILDNLGIIVNLDDAHKAYADTLGITVAQLTKAQRIEALRIAVVAQGLSTMDASATAANNESNAYARLGVAIENAKNRLGAYLNTDTQRTAGAAAAILSIDGSAASYQRAGAATVKASGDITRYLNALNPITATTNLVSAVNQTAIDKFNQLAGTAIPNTIFSINGITDAWNKYTGAAVIQHVEGEAGAFDAAAAAARYYASGIREIGPAAAAAGSAIDALNNKKVLPHLTDTKNTGAVGGLGAALTAGGNAAATAAKKTDAEAARLQDARDRLALAKATTSAQKIAELRRQQARATDPVEKLQLQAQIEQEIQSNAKSRTGELNKQASLNERIYDSIEKQRGALLDIEELTIKDRQQDRADVQKRKTALAILGSSRASADMKARASDALALIDVQDRQRANDIAGKSSTAGASIVNGRLLQSAPGGALPASAGASTVGALPSPVGAPGAAGAGAGAGLTINLVCDGKTLASVAEPYIMDALMNAIRGGRATIGG